MPRRIWSAILFAVVVALIVSGIVGSFYWLTKEIVGRVTHADDQIKSYLIWGGEHEFSPRVFKVQDGPCAIYVGLWSGRISVSTGKGC